MSAAEDELAFQLKALGIEFEREVRFAPPRRFRFDFVIGDSLAVEVQGGLYIGGRHSRGKGYERDLEKKQIALLAGFTVYECSPDMVKSGEALQTIQTLLELKNG